jgi:GT2 family glycosyltransferase
MKFVACITTMNRPKELDSCLNALWESSVKPYQVIISDNSEDKTIQEKNLIITKKYPGSIYIEGTHSGVSSNRNNALSHVPDNAELVTFLADDICVNYHFIELGIERYKKLSPEIRDYTILSGDNRNEFSPPHEDGPLGVNFRGFFCKWKEGLPQVVCLYASIFPKPFLDLETWDENIIMGQEDIELSLRALKLGYQILYCPEMRVLDTCFGKPSVPSAKDGPLKIYEIYALASQLYVGIKRYKYIFPNPVNLALFLIAYFDCTFRYLLRRGSLHSWPEIIKASNIDKLG